MRTTRSVAALAAMAGLLASCGGGGDRLVDATLDAPAVVEAPGPAVLAQPPAVVEAPGPAVVAQPPAPEIVMAPRQVVLDQPAVWPAPDVVFATPNEAAADFVSEVLGVPPLLGDFQQGDSRSGEIEVFSPGESGGTQTFPRGLLFVRQIGPTDGWYVIGASSDGITITSPATLAEVPAGPLTVKGEGRGFETTLNVIAFSAGDADAQYDLQIAAGGAFEQLEPYSATLDLSDASPGEVVALLVRGDTGLSDDPGEFAAITIVIDPQLPGTR